MDPNDKSDDKTNTMGTANYIVKCINNGFALIVAAIFFVTNPSKEALEQKLSRDGWVPVKIERYNWLLFSFNKITGFTGLRGIYLGVGGQYYRTDKNHN